MSPGFYRSLSGSLKDPRGFCPAKQRVPVQLVDIIMVSIGEEAIRSSLHFVWTENFCLIVYTKLLEVVDDIFSHALASILDCHHASPAVSPT